MKGLIVFHSIFLGAALATPFKPLRHIESYPIRFGECMRALSALNVSYEFIRVRNKKDHGEKKAIFNSVVHLIQTGNASEKEAAIRRLNRLIHGHFFLMVVERTPYRDFGEALETINLAVEETMNRVLSGKLDPVNGNVYSYIFLVVRSKSYASLWHQPHRRPFLTLTQKELDEREPDPTVSDEVLEVLRGIDDLNSPLFRGLSERDARIVLMRLKGQTLEEVSTQFRLSRERIRQIEVKELPRFRRNFQRELGF